MPERYDPPALFRSAHLQTIYPTLFRRVALTTPVRERIETPDGDFLDLDWSENRQGKQLAILTHGLEGSSRGTYCQGMAAALKGSGWDVLAWSFKGCSGEPNRLVQSYHSGSTDQLELVIRHAIESHQYENVALVGFSLGGNVVLKYLGDAGSRIDRRIRGGVAISVPCDLASSAKKLELRQNRFYMARFMKSLRVKVREKSARFPKSLSTEGLERMRTFAQFDQCYTAPIHGFRDAEDYWRRCSCRFVLSQISIPALLINALDDPFLTPDCFPHRAAKASRHLKLLTPAFGGHLGFVEFESDHLYWSERMSASFLQHSSLFAKKSASGI